LEKMVAKKPVNFLPRGRVAAVIQDVHGKTLTKGKAVVITLYGPSKTAQVPKARTPAKRRRK